MLHSMLAAAFFEDSKTLFAIGLVLLILFVWYFFTEIERRKRNVGSVLLFGIAAICIIAITPPKERLKTGIDISGGSSFLLRVQERETEGVKETVSTAQVDTAIKVIEQRLNGTGTAEPLIARQGADKILVQMPGVSEEESLKIKSVLEKVAKLEFRAVHTESSRLIPDILANKSIPPIGYKVFPYERLDDKGKAFSESILLSTRVSVTGKDVSRATPSASKFDAVDIVLTNDGGNKMYALTEHMKNREQIAVVLDGKVISAPAVESAGLGARFEINGLHRAGEREELSNALENPLENGLTVEEQRSVSPLLGAAIVEQGIWAGVLGLGVTFVLVLLYYRTAGLVAIFGLVLNTLMLFGIMAMFGFTFSLPGIAGMVLSVGMAVDANVLINERMREEIAAGKSLKAAISAAYDKAFSAILDANVTSLITAVILFAFASSTVKGFAVTLTIGIVASMFSAILATRVLFRWGVDLGILKKLSFLNLIQSKNFDFLGKRRACVAISIFLTLLSLGAFAWKKERAIGVDFTGGTRLQFLTGKDLVISNLEAEEKLGALKLHKAAFVQDESNPISGHMLTVRCDSRDAETVVRKLREDYPQLAEKVPATKATFHLKPPGGFNTPLDEVRKTLSEGAPAISSALTVVEETAADGGRRILVQGGIADADALTTKLAASYPTLQLEEKQTEVFKVPLSREEVSSLVGGGFITSSILALGLGLVGIFIYVAVRFETSFAVGAFVAILHDCIVSAGFVVLLGQELSLIHVGAILTIAGYSINDTIIIFDRIRESLARRTGGTLLEVMNEAINATLSRTILTSVATLVSVLCLGILGGAALRDFSTVILIGILIGTYSSIFVASPFVLWWNRGRKLGAPDDGLNELPAIATKEA